MGDFTSRAIDVRKSGYTYLDNKVLIGLSYGFRGIAETTTEGEQELYYNKSGSDLNPLTPGNEVTLEWTPSAYKIINVGALITNNALPTDGDFGSATFPFTFRLKAKVENVSNYFTLDVNNNSGSQLSYVRLSTYRPDFVLVDGQINIAGGVGAYSGLKPTTYDMVIGVPVFENEEDLDEYLETGDDSKDIRNEGTSDRKESYYYDYELDTYNPSTNQITSRGQTQSARFYLLNSSDYVAFVHVGDNTYDLQCSNNYVYDLNQGKEVEFSSIDIEVLKGTRGNQLGDIYTNIPFVENLEDARDLSNSREPNNTYNGVDENMQLTSISVSTQFIKPYYVTPSELNNIGKILYANDVDFITDLKEGLWMYQGNPIEAVVDVCMYPIDLTVFIDNQTSVPLKFGAFVYQGQLESVSQINYNIIQGTNRTYNLVNQKIMNIYNDFRDITGVSYSLFLPYVGIVELTNSVVGKVFKIDVKFDGYTGQLKYYIFINGSLYSTYECAIGRHISVLGSDWISKSNKNVESYVNAVESGFSAVKNIERLDSASAVSNTVNMVQSMGAYLQKPQTVRAGSSTSGLNIYDPLNVYLITEQFEYIKPSNLVSQYGTPCYKITELANCRGYVEVSDIKLKTSATDNEADEIINLVKSGIII